MSRKRGCLFVIASIVILFGGWLGFDKIRQDQRDKPYRDLAVRLGDSPSTRVVELISCNGWVIQQDCYRTIYFTTADSISEFEKKVTDAGLNILDTGQSHDAGVFSKINGQTSHKLLPETPIVVKRWGCKFNDEESFDIYGYLTRDQTVSYSIDGIPLVDNLFAMTWRQ
jgi:hypothetical protein